MNKKVFDAILEMNGDDFKAKFSGYLDDAKGMYVNAKQYVLEVEGVEDVISGVSKMLGKAGNKFKDIFGDTKEAAQKFFNELGETFDPKKMAIDWAKLDLARRMYVVAQEAGFTKEDANSLANHYFHGESVLEKLKNIFPNEHSPKLQEFIMNFSRKTSKISRENFREALFESKDEELLDAVLMEISVKPSLWYNGVTDEDLEDYFAKLYSSFATSCDVTSKEDALEDAKQALLKFL